MQIGSSVCLDPAGGLGVWVRWRSSDPSRQAENLATLRTLIIDHGPRAMQRVAERLQREGAPDRDRKPGDKCWVDELLPAILAEQAASSQASGSTNGANPTATSPLPAIVRQAHALMAQHGAAACRAALGWAPHIAPSDIAMRNALEREPVAIDLVDALGPQRAPVVAEPSSV
jgi:hypothetical protein